MRGKMRLAMSPVRSRILAAVLLGFLEAVAVRAETHQIDPGRSKVTVYVYKSGLFSAFADNHVIQAPIASGSFSDSQPMAVELVVHAADLKVLDPDLAAAKRAEVQTRMLSAEVLDPAKFADIAFTSTTIAAAGTDRWNINGRLTIHGTARPVTVAVVRQNGSYRGSVAIKQRDFGIEPISIAGGTIKVKDEIRIEFDIVAR